jgi:hypothetical protein
MEAPLVVVAPPPVEDSGVARAREILGSMKQKRECFSVALLSSRQTKGGIPENPLANANVNQPNVVKKPLLGEEETETITKQLDESLKEKRERLYRMTMTYSKTEPRLKEVEVSHIPNHEVSTIVGINRSTETPSVCSISTHDTHLTTGSGSPDASSSTPGHGDLPIITSIPPTLDDILKAFVNMPTGTTPSTVDRARASVFRDSSFGASSSASTEENETRGIHDAAARRMEGLETPPLIRRVVSCDIASIQMDDLDIPSVIKSRGSWDSVKSNSKSVSTSTRAPPICLSTAEGRSAYIESLYATRLVKANVEATPSHSSSPKRSPGRPFNRKSPRGARSSQTRTSSPSTLNSSQDQLSHIGSMYSQPGEEFPSYMGALYSPQRSQYSPQRNRTQGATRGAGNQIVVEAISPDSNLSTTASVSDIMDLSVVVRDQEKRRRHLASLHEARLPAKSPVYDSDFIISDDSSFDGTADSNTSGWVSNESESGCVDSLLGYNTDYNSDDDLAGDSFLTLLPFTGTPKKSKGQAGKSKVKSSVVRAPPKHVDANCVTTGGLYCIALASGLTYKTRIHVKVVRKRSRPKGLRLSTDFRCGTSGSHYDLAMRSGLDLSTPTPDDESREDGCCEGRGGLYDLAVMSGLKEAMEARTPFTVQIGAPRDDDEDTVASERQTDYECGASGSLFMAMESGATYKTVGSMYYISEFLD